MPDENQNAPNVIVTRAPKSAIAAFFLTFLFGPLGLLYASIGGGIFLILCAIILVPLTGGLGALFIWPVAMIWGVLAAMASKPGSQAAS
jgi:hypothetical protein